MQGRYFGGRTAKDGTIDWQRDATSIHNLVRAVAPPYPGAFTTVRSFPARLLRTRVIDSTEPPPSTPYLSATDGRLVAHCGGGGSLAILALEIEGAGVDASEWLRRFGTTAEPLGE